MKHTPGPWMVRGKLTIVDSHNKKIANMTAINVDKTNEEIEANARLIAASPTMYEYIENRAKEGDEYALDILEKLQRREEN